MARDVQRSPSAICWRELLTTEQVEWGHNIDRDSNMDLSGHSLPLVQIGSCRTFDDDHDRACGACFTRGDLPMARRDSLNEPRRHLEISFRRGIDQDRIERCSPRVRLRVSTY
jgi:hypothetical protein